MWTQTLTPCLILVTSKISAWFSLGQFFSHFQFSSLLFTYILRDFFPPENCFCVEELAILDKMVREYKLPPRPFKRRSNYPAGTTEYKHFHSGQCLSVFLQVYHFGKLLAQLICNCHGNVIFFPLPNKQQAPGKTALCTHAFKSNCFHGNLENPLCKVPSILPHFPFLYAALSLHSFSALAWNYSALQQLCDRLLFHSCPCQWFILAMLEGRNWVLFICVASSVLCPVP